MSSYWTCYDCGRYDRNDTNRYDEGFCTYYCKYYPKSDKACSRFEQRSDYVPSGCFLTTTICDMLGMEDNCFGLQTMRNFRDTVLVNDPKYYHLLAEYEVIGPIISDKIKNDSHGIEVAEYYFENYIYDIVMNLSTTGDYNSAVNKYVEMVTDLKRMYVVNEEISLNDVMHLGAKILKKQYKNKPNFLVK